MNWAIKFSPLDVFKAVCASKQAKKGKESKFINAVEYTTHTSFTIEEHVFVWLESFASIVADTYIAADVSYFQKIFDFCS